MERDKKKKTHLGSTHYESVQVVLSINKVMVDPLVELVDKAFQNIQNINDEDRNWKFINKLMNLITHLHLKSIEICQEMSRERNVSNELADRKKGMKKKLSKDRIKVKILHCDGPLHIGCSANTNNQLADGKMADAGTCDDQEPLSGQLPGHNASFEQTTSTCSAMMFRDHEEPESDNGLSIINNNDGDTELKEGIVIPVENCKGSNMCEDNIETVSLNDIDDGGAVCEDFPHNPSFSYRFMGFKTSKLFWNSPYSSTEESFSKNSRAEDNGLLQDVVGLQSDLSKRDTSLPVLNENFDLKNEDEVDLRGDTLNESVGLKIEKKVKLKEDDTLNMTDVLNVKDGVKLKEDNTLNVIVGSKVEDGVKQKEDDTLNVTVGLKVEDGVKWKEDDTLNVIVGLKVEDGVKQKEDDTLNVTDVLNVKDGVKLKEDDTLNVIVGSKVEDGVKQKEDDILNVTVGLKVEDGVKWKEDDTLNVIVGLKVEDGVKLKEDDTLNVTVGLKVEDGVKQKEDDTLNVIVGLKVEDGVNLKDGYTLNVTVGSEVEDVKWKEDVMLANAHVLNIVGKKMVGKAKIDLQLNFSTNISLKKKIVVTL